MAWEGEAGESEGEVMEEHGEGDMPLEHLSAVIAGTIEE